MVDLNSRVRQLSAFISVAIKGGVRDRILAAIMVVGMLLLLTIPVVAAFSMRQMLALERDVFWGEMAGAMANWWPEGERNVFVYIHGYNVDFEEAAVQAAQLLYDLKLPGEFAFFSWPLGERQCET